MAPRSGSYKFVFRRDYTLPSDAYPRAIFILSECRSLRHQRLARKRHAQRRFDALASHRPQAPKRGAHPCGAAALPVIRQRPPAFIFEVNEDAVGPEEVALRMA